MTCQQVTAVGICGKPAKVVEGGKHYCGKHAPKFRVIKSAKAKAKADAQYRGK